MALAMAFSGRPTSLEAWPSCLDDGHRIGQFIEVGTLAVKRQAMTFGCGGDPEVVFRDGLSFGGESLLEFGISGGRGVIGQEKNDILGESLPLLDGAAAVASALNTKAHFTKRCEREIKLHGRLERVGNDRISRRQVPDDNAAV